jgi:hypothetical protein
MVGHRLALYGVPFAVGSLTQVLIDESYQQTPDGQGGTNSISLFV